MENGETESLVRNPSTRQRSTSPVNSRGAAPRSWTKRLWLGCAVVLGLAVLVVHGTQEQQQAGEEESLHDLTAIQEQEEEEFATDELLGSSKKDKKKNKKEARHVKDGDMDYCMDGYYSKRTLQLAYELPFAALFLDNKGQKKYEASDVILVDEDVYAVCDSSWAISKFSRQLKPFSSKNSQVGDPIRDSSYESGYEAIVHDDGTFYVLRESVQQEDETYHAVVEELSMPSSDTADVDYAVTDTCNCEYEFEGDSKGFEGAISVRNLENELILLGLCEGNHCSESRKNDRGNGRVVVMQKGTVSAEDGNETCQWKTIREIKIPESADFLDYSAISLNDDGKVAITSQEDSQLWIGKLRGKREEDGLWDISAMEFDTNESKVFDFPKNNQCFTMYCNIEGIHWINDEMLMAVSDKMKSKGKQDFRCFDKDQSVHVFALP